VALLSSGDYERIAGAVSQVVCTVPAMVVVAANHRLAKKRVVSLEDLRAEEVVGFKHQDAPGRYRNFLAACRDAGFSPRVTYVASIFPELCMAVKQRMGVGIISSFASPVPHPGVVFIKLKPPGVQMEIYTAHAVNAAPAALELERLIAGAAKRAAVQAGGQ
jgi:DNA-binding transcriptional LysR family regulator